MESLQSTSYWLQQPPHCGWLSCFACCAVLLHDSSCCQCCHLCTATDTWLHIAFTVIAFLLLLLLCCIGWPVDSLFCVIFFSLLPQLPCCCHYCIETEMPDDCQPLASITTTSCNHHHCHLQFIATFVHPLMRNFLVSPINSTSFCHHHCHFQLIVIWHHLRGSVLASAQPLATAITITTTSSWLLLLFLAHSCRPLAGITTISCHSHHCHLC